MTLTPRQIAGRETPEPARNWSARAAAETGAAQPFRGNEEEASRQLLALLQQSVAQQMVADVPVGAFLSGGIDSSLVVALMQRQSASPVKTFSIGFEERAFDEALYARAVARHLGTDHTELYIHPAELRHTIPLLPGIYDEPLADASQIPTVLLCQLARQQVKVTLSGDGGDELFGGYDRYRKVERLWKALAWMPQSFRQQLAQELKSIANAGSDSRFACRLSNLSELVPAQNDRRLYELLISPNRNTRAWLRDSEGTELQLEGFSAWECLPDLLQRMTHVDFTSYLPDDVLVKVDRAAMSVGLETRVPLLDHHIVEFAFSLAGSLKRGKRLLRRILYQLVPRALVDRPKCGFVPPIAEWLRGPLRGWAGQLLDEKRLEGEGFFNVRTVQRKWQEHLSRARDWSMALWHVLTFQAWLDEQKPAGTVTQVEACQP